MGVAFRVDVEQSIDDAREYLACGALVQAALLGDEFEEVATTTVLEEHVHKELVLVRLGLS